MSFFNTFLDFILPRHCAICDRELTSEELHLCNICLVDLRPIRWDSTDDNPAIRTLWGLADVEKAGSALVYGHSLPHFSIFIHFKYGHYPQLARHITRHLFPYWQDRGLADGVDYIVPIPLHWRRRLSRGYNQSEWIARGVSDVTGIPVNTHILRRIRNNPTLTRISTDERQKNTNHIFGISARCPVLDHRTILLVDDILTTGATLTDGIRAIHDKYPNAHIRVFTLGFTQRDSR